MQNKVYLESKNLVLLYKMAALPSNLQHIKVGFKDWEEDINAAYAWVYDVAETGNFECLDEQSPSLYIDY